MTSRLMAGAVSASLCLTPTLARAQEHRLIGFEPPRGASATVNVRVPLGGRAGARSSRPTIGLSAGYGWTQGDRNPGQPGSVRRVDLLDLRLDRRGIERARLAGLDLGGLADDRLPINPGEGGKKATVYLFFFLLLAIAAGIVLTEGDGQGGARPPVYTPPEGD